MTYFWYSIILSFIIPFNLFAETSFGEEGKINLSFAEKTKLQKEVMLYTRSVINGIKNTDYKKTIWGLSKLAESDLDNIIAPLSISYELINGISNGREDFMNIGFKDLYFKQLKKISQQIFKSVIKNRTYVSEQTKKKTINRLKDFRKNLNPSKEACSSAMSNINYIIL